MTGSSWRFIARNPGIDCWTAWSGRDETFLLIPVEHAPRLRLRRPHARRAHRPRPELVDTGGRGVPGGRASSPCQAVAGGELHHGAVDEVRLKQWHDGRLVLIGDAAHATGPVWAQGVAMALEDALILGELLARTPIARWESVGAEFERIRRPRVEHVRSATEKMSRLAALPGRVRDIAAPVLGPRSYRQAYGPLRTGLTT